MVIDLAGFSEWTLRLFPLICGIVSLFLFGRVSQRVFGDRRLPTLLAVGILAVSVHPIRHAAEAKPYATDLLVAAVLLLPAVEWLRRPRVSDSGWLWTLTALAPPALTLSNPSIFVAGGVGLGLIGPVWRSRSQGCRLAFGAYVTALAMVFGSLYCFFGRAQSAAAIDGLMHYWASSFPPLANPLRLPGWLFQAHTGSVFAYPGGGANGASTPTFLAFMLGAVVLAKRGEAAVVSCLLAPFGLAFLASAFHLYPYGTEARLMQFAAPSICLLAGQGTAWAIERVALPRRRQSLIVAALALLLVYGIVPQVISYVYPYRMLYDRQARDFARNFWAEQAIDAELSCAHLDFRVDRKGTWLGRRAWYLCNQMIYSPQRQNSGSHPIMPLSADHPLRCVLHQESPGSPAVRNWLAAMQQSFSLKNTKTYKINVIVGEGQPAIEEWRVFDFVPRDGVRDVHRPGARAAMAALGPPRS
jgi:hypothetical protein